jgi:AcrR family transcriptional regulator
MSRRAASKQETRRRILEATAALHTRKGILGTTYQDIAHEADVSLATVYNHFPTLDELVEGCGGLLMERYQPPSPEDAPEVIGNARGARARFARVTAALYDLYTRAAALVDIDVRERELPQVRAAVEYHYATVAAFATEALKGTPYDAQTIAVVTALLDFPAFKALRDRGVTDEAAVNATVDMAMAILNRTRRRGRQSASEPQVSLQSHRRTQKR